MPLVAAPAQPRSAHQGAADADGRERPRQRDGVWSRHQVAESSALAPQVLAGYSFEINSDETAALHGVARRLPRGAQITITSRPSDRIESLLAAIARVGDLGFEPVPCIAARRYPDARALARFLDAASKAAALGRVFLVAGDERDAGGALPDALAVIASGVLEDHGIRHVGIAGYPEGHPQIGDGRLWAALLDKRDALAARGIECSITTQFSFAATTVSVWIEQLRRRGFDGTVRIGVPAPAAPATLLKFAARFGVLAPRELAASAGPLSAPATQDLVSRLVGPLSRQALADVRLHFLTFSAVSLTVDWIEAAQRLPEPR